MLCSAVRCREEKDTTVGTSTNSSVVWCSMGRMRKFFMQPRRNESFDNLLGHREIKGLENCQDVAKFLHFSSFFSSFSSFSLCFFTFHFSSVFFTQATIALISSESEFHATGSATARRLQCKVYLSETERLSELDVYSDSTAGRGMCQRTGVGKVRHLELRFLWIQERLRLKSFRLNMETTEEMTADILTKYCEWPKIEQHCATLNLRFPVKGLSSLMVAGFLVHCANADVEAVSGEAGLNAVNPVTDSQGWQSVPIVSLVLLLAMLMSFGLDCCCDWFSVVCRARFGHHGERERVLAQFRMRLAPPWKPDRGCQCGM